MQVNQGQTISVVLFKDHWTNPPHYEPTKYHPADNTGQAVIAPAPKAGKTQRSGTYDHAEEMVQEANKSMINQGRRAQSNMRSAMYNFAHNPARKQKLTMYTQPLQDIISPFAKNRQMSSPGGQRAFNRNQAEVQPSLKFPSAPGSIPTSMPFNNPY
jgi:hypothetical protein